MKKEYKYFGTIFFIFLLSATALTVLLRKYAFLTFQHFIETCQQILPTFFSSGVHFIGLALVALVSFAAVVFCAKTLFSLIKTQRKVDKLLEYKINAIPNKLSRILRKQGLSKDEVLVVNKSSNHAFNYGLLSRKIVISKGLIHRLTANQLEAVILHEKYHLESKHSLLLIISEIVSSTMFFLPLAKEINKRMKIVFEKQADTFAVNIQGNKLHLRTALLKVPSSKLQFYPGFAMRRQHKVSQNSIYGTLFAVLVLLSLLLFPASTHATNTTIQLSGKECAQSQCSTHCPTVNMSFIY